MKNFSVTSGDINLKIITKTEKKRKWVKILYNNISSRVDGPQITSN